MRFNSPHNPSDIARLREENRRVIDPKIVDDLARRIAASVPDSITALQTDLVQNFRAALQAGLGQLDLVTREEFDVQSGVLRRTREKLERLEKRLAELETQRTTGQADD
jgi:BMFP domain-containing protein YqiC